MSTGAVYIAANNDGQMDELLYMSGLLNRRLTEIRRARLATFQQMQAANQDVSNYALTPTMTDITASHTLLPSKSYRPYVTTTFQYLKTRLATGNNSLGSDSTFLMKVFGEFMSDTMLYIVTSPLACADVNLQNFVIANEATALPPNSSQVGGSTTVTQYDSSLGPGVYPPPFSATVGAAGNNYWTYYSIEDAAGNVLMDRGTVGQAAGTTITAQVNTAYPTPILVRDYVVYYDFPIHALITAVQFQVNSVPIDNYTQERDNFHLIYLLMPGKVNAYYKCVGQELPNIGYTDLITNYVIPGDVTIPGYSGASGVVTARKQVNVMTGYQTPAYQQPPLVGLYPNKFDHCRDVSCSIPVLAIPNTDRTFVYSFATQDKVATSVAANVFAVKTVITYTTGVDENPTAVSTTRTRTALKVNGAIGTLTFTQLFMYINNLFIDPSIHDIYLERVGFSLTRVHRTQSINITTSESDNLLSTFKWPLEFMFVGLRPSTNLLVSPQTNWWKFTYNTPMTGDSPSKLVGSITTGFYGTPAEVYIPQTLNGPNEVVSYNLQYPTVTTLQISLQTIPLYETTDSAFFNSYLPYVYGGYNIATSAENSSMFVTFNFYPNDNGSPNGHVNVSRSREFMVKVVSNVIGSGNLVASGNLHVVGIVINFWISSSGNLYLRFT